MTEPRPSASVILLSPENKVLLLHRVKESSSFPSSYVFPGGNISTFQDIRTSSPGKGRHEDSVVYRLAAIRETFEESGILLAREEGKDGKLISVPNAERDKARKAIHQNRLHFNTWVEELGAVPDTDNLVPFTRWITPPSRFRRYTTQMYLYMLPLSASNDPTVAAAQAEAIIPTPDGGVEINAAHFDYPSTWLEKQLRGEITVFPPQCFLLHLMSQFLVGPPSGSLSDSEAAKYYETQREKLRSFIAAVPTTSDPKAAEHPTAQIPWAEKVICPSLMGLRKNDGKTILGLQSPGPELRNSGRGGDWEKVVLTKFVNGASTEVEVRNRVEVLEKEREAENEAQNETRKAAEKEAEGEPREAKL
ncbi:uncharacterized protein F4812DRAFT_214863 [Daldinia caldariorum]|uniref:uncharacterized protein n=1 Tax=Daldinia caldariorum TaxID=326644 RepID=UPI0020077E9D|nr:uncharacterized protein F4812DRAFT_214863 [Daldinia caldariorum]KAI1464181.1 hypothetical protein F4812DRAFT_214863 [Daldinia caldariorum]